MMPTIEMPIRSGAVKQDAIPRPAGGLTRKASLNVVASLLDWGAKVIIGLLVTPVLVGGLGRSLFGVWEMLMRLVGYMYVVDGRPMEILKLIIANQQAVKDPAIQRRHVGSALGIWLIFLPVLVVAGTILVWLAPTITKVPPELHTPVRFACALLAFNLVLANLVAVPESVMRGMNLGYKRMGLQAGLSVVGGALTVGAIYLGLGLIGVAGVQVVLSALTGLMFWYVAKRYVSWFGIARPTLAEIRSFFGLSIWNYAGTLVTHLLLASDIVILGMATQASTVTTYVLNGYAAQATIGVMSLALGALTPGLGGVVGQKQHDKAARLRQEMLSISWLSVTVIGSTILLWNRSFVGLWVGASYYAGFWVNLLIALIMVQTVFIRTDAYVIDTTLRLRGRVAMSALAVLLFIPLAVMLTWFWEMVGLCLAILVGRLVQTVSYPLLVHSYLGRRKQVSFHRLARPAFVMCLLFAASGYLGQQLLSHNWFEWVVGVGVSLGLVVCVALVAGLSAEARGQLARRLRTMWLQASG
jgi:O-antigen/teichoic acid export membrane protein